MVAVALGEMGISASTSGRIKNSHSRATWISYQSLRMVFLSVSKIDTVSLVKRTLKYTSQKGVIPTSEFLKFCEPCTDNQAVGGEVVRVLHVAVYFCMLPVTVTIMIGGAD